MPRVGYTAELFLLVFYQREWNCWAIDTSLYRRYLEVAPILNCQDFLCGKETRSTKQIPALESASLWDFEPKFVDSQALDFGLEGPIREP